MKKFVFTLVTASLIGLVSLSLSLTNADDLTIPNTFTANTPARAAEVNENFSAVESSVDANAANIESVAQIVATIASHTEYKFVGFSTGTVQGNVGFFGMTAECIADFGPGARMASTEEFINTHSGVTPIAFSAWVHPVIVAASSDGSGGNYFVWDYSGVAAPNGDASCKGWFAGDTGMVIRHNGAIRLEDCDVARPVACSVPQ